MKKKTLRLNPAQRLFHNISYYLKYSVNVWGRGTGKSSYGIATVMRNVIHFMPRSKWLITAESYKAMLENTLPSTIRALEGLGYFRDIHYVIGVKPPKQWPTAYEPPTRGYTNSMTFFNGAMFQLVSQDSSATSARGLNTDGSIMDEGLNIDKEHYDEEIAPTIRANQTEFGNIPFHLGEFVFTSMPYGTSAEWITDTGKYYLKDNYDYQRLMAQLIQAQLEFLNETNETQKATRWNECIRIRKELNWYPKRVERMNTFYMESNTFDNIRIMGYDYINGLYRKQSTLRFMTEIMNQRQNKVEGAFYAHFDRNKHTYKRYWGNVSTGVSDAETIMDALGDNFDLDKAMALGCASDRDCIANEPLHIGLDFGGKINSMVVGQHLQYLRRFNFIKDFFVKTPDGIDELADNFAEYYRFHATKLIYLYYDSFGNQVVGNSKRTYAEQVQARLESKGWSVILMTTGSNPFHHDKFLLWSNLLSEKPDVTIAFNYYNCQATITSIEGVKVKESKGEIKKDKSGESKNLETEEKEPHLSDAADYVIYKMFRTLLKSQEEFHDTRLSK